MICLWEDQTCYPQHHAGHPCPWEAQENLLFLWGWLQVTLQMCFEVMNDFYLSKEGNFIDNLMAVVVATLDKIWVFFFFLDEVGSKGDWEYWSQYWLLLYSESHLPRPSVAYRTCPSGSRAGWLTPLDEGLSPWHISSCPSLIWDSFWRRWCVHTSGRAVIFQSFWSQCLFTLLNYWGLQWVLVSAGYIYWYLSYNRDQQTLAYGPSLAHDCFFVKKNLVEHSQVHLFMYCLWFFRASLVAQMVKDWETCVWSLGWEDSLGGGHGNTL